MTIKSLNKWFREHYPKYIISLTKEDNFYKATITSDKYYYNDNIITFIVRSKRLGNLKTRILEYLEPNTDKTLNLIV